MWTKDCNPGNYNKKKIAGSKLRIPVGYPGYQRFSFSHVWGCVCASQQIFGQRTKPRETKPKVSVEEAYDSKLAITVKQNFLIYLFIFFTDTCNFIFQVLHTLLWLQKKGRQFFIMLMTVMIRWENSSSFFPSETKRSANPEGWHIFTGEVVSQRFWAMNVNRKCYFALLSRDFEQIFGQIVSIKVKTPSNINLVRSRHFKREKRSLPVDVRRSKTSLVKLPTRELKRRRFWATHVNWTLHSWAAVLPKFSVKLSLQV